MNPRKEIEFPWGEAVIRSRPTLAKVSEVERKFGPVTQILTRLARQELSLSTELLPLLGIMLRGADGAPKTDKAIAEDAFDIGAVSLLPPMIDWLQAAYMTNEPQDETAAPAGN